jgi:acetate kinase
MLTIYGGSSSIKFALLEVDDSLRQIPEGGIKRIGLLKATLLVKCVNQQGNIYG